MKLPSYILAFKSALDSIHFKNDINKIDVNKGDKLFLLYNSEENVLKIRSNEDGKFSIDVYIHQIKWGDIVEVCGFVYNNDEHCRGNRWKKIHLIFHFDE